ncbi:MAG TPA: right-handed parallel beta-helix repeat-containing protein [Anaerolineales bacterium]|nr:right-handed parallel beta-helix repeat-containing protein [Anaerolineales bacterium]
MLSNFRPSPKTRTTSTARIGSALLALVLICSLLGLSNTHASAAGTTYYVDNTVACADTNAGTLQTAPWCTLAKAEANAKNAGDTVIVLHGTYAESVTLQGSGAAGSPITFKAGPGAVVTVTGHGGTSSAFAMASRSYIVIDGFTITETRGPGIYADTSDHITISNNHVSYAGHNSGIDQHVQGIKLKTTTNSTITGNTVDHNSCIGIRLVDNSNGNIISNNVSYANDSTIAWPVVPYSDAAGIEVDDSNNNTIVHNDVHGNEDSGINLYVGTLGTGSANNTVSGNLSYGNGDHGIDNNGAPNNIIVGNTIQGNFTSGINLEANSAGATLANNVLVNNGSNPGGRKGGNIYPDSTSLPASMDYNLYFQTSASSQQINYDGTPYLTLAAFKAAHPTLEVHGLEVDPKLVSPGAPNPNSQQAYAVSGNYHIQSGSPAIDSANSGASGEQTTDIEGNARFDDPATANTGAGTRTYDDRGAYEFKSATQQPTVTTQAVTNIGTTTATGNGNVTSLGVPNPTQHGVAWGTAANPTVSGSHTSDGAVSATGAFTSNITGLTAGTLYHVRAYATNTAGTAYGSDVTFTSNKLPTVTTQAVTDITPTTATGNGNVTALGVPNPTDHGVAWGTSANPTVSGSHTSDGAVSAIGAFTSSITGLTAGTLYHVRAYATNAAGTAYGSDVTFTPGLTPTVTTQAVTSITATTATGNGNVTSLGAPNPTQHGVAWGTSANPTVSGSHTSDGAVSATGAFTSNITGLTSGTLYHVRAYATNAIGTSYGDDVTFTAAKLPTVTTQAVTNVAETTATGNGNVTALGIPNPTQHGVAWGTAANPTISGSHTSDGAVSATGAFTSNITGLTGSTLYHVRAYATNDAGTAYGSDVTFTTPRHNTAPVIAEGASTTVNMSVNGTPTPFALTLHATDAESDPITWSISTAAAHGIAAVQASNVGESMQIDYAPEKNYIGSDSFVVTTDDGLGGVSTITVNVNVAALSVTRTSVGGSDGWVLESGELSNKGGSMNSALTTFNLGDDASRKQYRGILSFNTSLPAGAVITNVTIKVKTSTPGKAASMFTAFGNIAVDLKNGSFGAAALEAADFQAAATKGGAMTIKNAPLSGGWFTASLAGANADTWINKAGTTQFRLRFSKDDNNDSVANVFTFYSGNAPTANRPVLVIQYYIPLP